jgi:predicted dehydrogenase
MQDDYGDDLAYGWRFDPERGTGILGDLGSHMIDMARWYVGEIVQVSGRLATDVARPKPDGAEMTSFLHDSATVLVEFAGGASGTIQVSGARAVGGPDVEVRLFGDEGSLKLDFGLTDGRISGWRRGDESWSELAIPYDLSGTGGPNPSILDLPSLAPFTNLPVADRQFVDAVLDGFPAEPTFEDGWRVQEVIDAVLTSDRRKCWVSVSS